MADTEHPAITVDAAALRQVLQALVGPAHYIRELQTTRSLHALGHPNPIETLVEQFNTWAATQAQEEKHG